MASAYQQVTATASISVNSSYHPEDCQVRKVTTFLAFSMLPAISIFVNSVTLLAIILYRHKLRQNNVYYHVGNTLITNVIFSLLSLYQIISLYFALHGSKHEEHPRMQGLVMDETRVWIALYRALLTSLFLVMCCNIGVLISAIRDTTHGPLLFGSRALELSSNQNDSLRHGRILAKMFSHFDRKRRSRRAWLMIFAMWTLPLCYVISAPLGWSCAWECQCLSGCYKAFRLNSVFPRLCSRVWPPMRYDWLFVGVGAWFLCVIIVIIVLWRAIRDTKRHFAFCRNRFSSSEDIYSIEVDEVALRNDDTITQAVTHVKSPRHNSLVKSYKVLSQTLKSLRYLIWITVFFVLCTAPAMSLIFIDYFSSTNPSMLLGNSCLCMPFVYCWICPFFLSSCLPRIRSAVASMMIKLCSVPSFLRSESSRQ